MDKSSEQINSLKRKDIEDIKVITFDVDGVTVPRGTKISYKNDELNLHIKRCPKQIAKSLKGLARFFHINISSGRSLLYLLEMYRDCLDIANLSFTVENGHYTYFNNSGMIVQHRLVKIYERTELMKIRNRIEKKGEIEPKEMQLTLHVPNRIMFVSNIRFKYNGEAYDIGNGEKGDAVKYFQKNYGKVLAIGDNVNDQSMLEAADISVTADRTKVSGHYYIDFKEGLPAEILINQLLKLKRQKYVMLNM